MMIVSNRTCRPVIVAALTAFAVACSGQRDPKTPQEAAARGDELLRKMSDTLKGAQALSFTVGETHERVRRNGQKEPYFLRRDVVVRRPNRLWSHTTGSDDRDVKVTYDGNTVTIVGDTQKVYATIKAPATLDETLDLVSQRYDLRVAVADFLYSSPRSDGSRAMRAATIRDSPRICRCVRAGHDLRGNTDRAVPARSHPAVRVSSTFARGPFRASAGRLSFCVLCVLRSSFLVSQNVTSRCSMA
jgi:hypothetical protein